MGGEYGISADDLLSGNSRGHKLREAQKFLQEVLAEGALPQTEIEMAVERRGLKSKTLCNARYDKDPLVISVKETWRYIFTEWFAQCSYNIDETKYAFELYDERCHASENAVISIYVPIKAKGKGDVL